MRISIVRKWLGLAVIATALSVGSGLVLADGDDDGDGGNPLASTANPTFPEMQDNAPKLIAEMEKLFARVIKLQAIADKQDDVMKINCVADKYLQIKGWLNVADSRRHEMDAAIDAGKDQDAFYAYGDIVIAHSETRTLAAAAEQCIGKDLSWVGKQENSYEDGDEEDDPTKGEDPDFPEVEPLPCASCSK